jgi:hypothetical protein
MLNKITGDKVSSTPVTLSRSSQKSVSDISGDKVSYK